MAEEKETTSAFDRFSKMGAIMGEASLSQEQGRRGDYASSLEDFEKGYDLALKFQKNARAKVNKNKEATQKLLDQFPGGVSVPKMDQALDGLVSNFLKDQRGIYETNARIEGQGADAEGYDLAVGSNNQIDQNVIAVNNDLEVFANTRTALLKEVGGIEEDEQTGQIDYKEAPKYAKGTTKEQEQNLYNLTSGDYESLKPEITYNDKGDARLTILDAKGNRVNVNEIDLPEEYDNAAETTYDNLIDATQKTKEEGGVKSKSWEGSVDRRKAIKSIKNTFKDQKTIKNYMYEAVDKETGSPLIDLYVANDLGISEEELRKDPEYENKIEMYKDIPFDINEIHDLLIEGLDNTYNGAKTVQKQTTTIVVEGDRPATDLGDDDTTASGDDGGIASQYNKTASTTKENEEKAEEVSVLGGQILNNARFVRTGKSEIKSALNSGKLTDEILTKYFSGVTGITIENNEVKGIDNLINNSARDFNEVMKRIQINEGIDLGYRIDRKTRARLTEEVTEEQDN